MNTHIIDSCGLFLGKMIAGKPIYVALAQLKSERQAQLVCNFLIQYIETFSCSKCAVFS